MHIVHLSQCLFVPPRVAVERRHFVVFVVGFNFCVCMFRKEEESGAGGGGYSVLVDEFVVYRLGIYK